MDVVSACDLPVASLVQPASTGGFVLTAIVRATIDFATGGPALMATQPAVEEGDARVFGLTPTKPHVEVFALVTEPGPAHLVTPGIDKKVDDGAALGPMATEDGGHHAPADQCIEAWTSLAAITLESAHGTLQGRLPQLAPRLQLPSGQAAPMRCDTIVLDAAAGRCSLIWRFGLPIASADAPGQLVVSLPAPLQQQTAQLSPGAINMTMVDDGAIGRQTLPFDMQDKVKAALEKARRRQAQPGHGLPFQGQEPPQTAPSGAAAASPWAGGAPPDAAQEAAAKASAAAARAAAMMRPAVADVRPPDPIGDAPPNTEPAGHAPPESEPPPTREPSKHIVQLIWFEPDQMHRVRAEERWAGLLDALAERDFDDAIEDPALHDEPAMAEDRREMHEVLTEGASTPLAFLRDELLGRTSDRGKLLQPIVLVEGDLVAAFDPRETLRATVAAAAPFVSLDEGIAQACSAAKDFLGTDAPASPATYEAFAKRVRRAFDAARGEVPAHHLEEQVRRALLEGRRYETREVFGDTHLRATLHETGEKEGIPSYIPADLALDLPLYDRMHVRLVAELGLKEDQFETQPVALRVFAIARLLPRGSW